MKKKIALILIVMALGWFVFSRIKNNRNSQPALQTTKPETGTLIVSLSATGQVSTANNASVTTQTSGVIKKIYVENGQQVKVGSMIAEVELDLIGRLR